MPAILDQVTCEECQDALDAVDGVGCSCGRELCENCYVEHGHDGHDSSPENLSLREFLRHERSLVERDTVLERLTARERGIVFWVVAGLCLADVGDVLGISASNVKFRLSLIREKLGVRDETQMVVYVLTGYRPGEY